MTSSRPPKYLVCVSDRPESRIALRFACARALARGGRVEIIHVLSPAEAHTLPNVSEMLREEQRANAEALMNTLAQEAHNASGMMPSFSLREGLVGEEILAAALADYDASMLVLGASGQTPNSGRLIAWLSAQLGSKLFIPVLLVPGNLTDEQLQNLL